MGVTSLALMEDFLVGGGATGRLCQWCLYLKARLHGSPRLINAVESTKVNRVNSSFQRK